MKTLTKSTVFAMASLFCMVSATAFATDTFNYKGHGGWRTDNGSGGWTTADRGYAQFSKTLDECKQVCLGDSNCKGVEYISNPNGWMEPNVGWVPNKCEIHHDPYKHCDTSFTGGLGLQDGCWVREPPAPPPPEKVAIKSVQVANGSGCPIGSATSVVAADGQSASVLFNRFAAEKSNSTTLWDTFKDCNFVVEVQVPKGYQLPGIAVDYLGNVIGKGDLYRQYAIIGNTKIVEKTDQFTSPNGVTAYNKRDTLLPLGELPWPECGATAKLRVYNRVSAVDNPSLMQLSSADVSNSLTIRLGEPVRCGP